MYCVFICLRRVICNSKHPEMSHYNMKTKVIYFLIAVFLIANKGYAQSKIYLIGERHNLTEDNIRNDSITQEAQKGDFFLALEGKEFLKEDLSKDSLRIKTIRVFGVEDQFELDMVMAMKFRLLFYLYLNNLDDGQFRLQKVNFITSYLNSPHFIDAWNLLERPLKDKYAEEVALNIDLIIQNKDSEIKYLNRRTTEKSLCMKFVKSEVFMYNYAFSILSNKITNAFYQLAQEKKDQYKNMPNLALYQQFNQQPFDKKLELEFTNKFAVNWRNETIAKNIALIYKQSKKEKKDLKVIIGQLHLKGIENKLKEFTKAEIVLIKSNSVHDKKQKEESTESH